MSAFDQHRVSVQLRKPKKTSYGTTLVNDGDPISGVPCTVRFLSTSEVTSEGLVLFTYGRLIAREWPGDEHSLVTFQGRDYDTKGEPLTFDGSPATAHVEVSLVRVPANLRG